MKKLLASDYDGTFYINDDDISNNVELIKKLMKKNIFAIVTGRSYLDFMRKRLKYNIAYNYLAINHGATIIYCDHVLYNKFIDDKVKDEILKLLNKEKYEELFLCSKLESRVDESHEEITKIHVTYDQPDKADKMYKKLLEKYKDKINCIMLTNGKEMEIVDGSVDKLQAVEFIANKERIPSKRIYTVGNGITDLKMINTFNGYMIASSNNQISGYNGNYINSVSEIIKNIK